MNREEAIEQVYSGTAVSRGIAIAPVLVAGRGLRAPEAFSISEAHVSSEQKRFTAAVARTRRQLSQLQTQMEMVSGTEEALVFEAHSMMLEDPGLTDQVHSKISERLQNAEACFYAVMQTYLEAMRRVSDSYLQERTIDIQDVCERVLRNFADDEESVASPEAPHVLVSYDLTPSDTASMDRSTVLGFVTETGSINSHTAILARALGIPAIVGIDQITLAVSPLTPCIIDGYSGIMICNPTEQTLDRYRELASRRLQERAELESLKDQESQTKDGHHLTLSANIEFTHELDFVREQRAEGVGLFRTEFFLLQNEVPPDEEAQTRIYRDLAVGTAPHQAIIRTLDAGGDKLLSEPLLEPEPNPFLGWRGIRVSLDRQDAFKAQIRAVLRASTAGNLGLMFPFISGVTEFRRSRALVQQCMEELEKEGASFNSELEIGAMIEIPSAALMADHLAEEADFFSIGTNDLIQYTVAVDRVNNRVANLYRSSHPAVMRLIHTTTQAAKRAGIWTGVCGEMAADLNLTPLLIGLGVDELSVGPHDLAAVRKAILSLNLSSCQELAAKALTLPTSFDVLELSRSMARDSYPGLLKG